MLGKGGLPTVSVHYLFLHEMNIVDNQSLGEKNTHKAHPAHKAQGFCRRKKVEPYRPEFTVIRFNSLCGWSNNCLSAVTMPL